MARRAAELLSRNRLVGWFQGRMEFGPRALGCRSILSDPRFVENRDRVNDAVKFRENWRPFAPSVLVEKAGRYFQDFKPSPYMILASGRTKRARTRSRPWFTWTIAVGFSPWRVKPTRVITHCLEFEKLTNVPVLMNTSFNLKGDPIVCSPKDAVQTFYTSGLDDLVIGDFVVSKTQPEL